MCLGPESRVAVVSVLVVFCFAPITRAADAIQIVTAARAVQPGEVVLFTATADAPIDALRARAFDRDLPAFRRDARTWQVVLGIDLDTPAASYDGTYRVLDTGARIRRRRVDLYVPDCGAARRFGRRSVEVSVIRKRQ